MDILLGNFNNKYIDLFNENELNLFDSILECDDEDIYQWILGKKEIPENYSNRTLQLLINTTQNLKFETYLVALYNRVVGYRHPERAISLLHTVITLAIKKMEAF